MANSYGRQVVLTLTNKSGGGVIAGDVVIVDTSNDGAFTTTTSAQSQKSVGVAQETIANNASGRILVSGYAALVNVQASVTRGHYLETYTVAKQGNGNSSRRAGSFGQFLTGGTTPTAWLWGFPDNAGASGETVAASTIWDAKGDLAAATGADTAAKLTVGANGTHLEAASGQTTGLKWSYPPAYEFDYVEFTSPVSVTNTAEGSADTVVTGSSVSYDGSTAVYVEFFAPALTPQATAAAQLAIYLFEGATSLGIICTARTPASSSFRSVGWGVRKLTPSNGSHTYTIKATTTSGTSTVTVGTGGTGNFVPGYIRIRKA